jgi:ABC-2 type transport system ATP-binding protein
MKLILGLLKPDSGHISVCGERVNYGQTKTNRHIGYLPDVPEFYPFMKPLEYLKLCGEITGLSGREIKQKSRELLSLVGLERENKKIGCFSRGMKQRLGIAQALLNTPKLLICDEPTSALDPMGRKEILEILKQVKGKTTVIFSTHILSDVERICDAIVVLHKGKPVLSGPLSQIKAHNKRNSLQLTFQEEESMRRFLAILQLTPFLAEAERTKTSLTLHARDIRELQSEILDILHKQKLFPDKLEILEPTLESLFIKAVES